ncbi:unnamed protein product [Cuscuta epithymum]|uniref:PUM-HD domain-containing protein n=1 Tax=Cuscuta epithymum TaxID=186058 RepID=A0AAV0DCI2_9ASTE|nr:unnamed protein product [Cuscuta epithymum]CAH9137549.1 unnamed protein product [Cuscuta epithymum]
MATSLKYCGLISPLEKELDEWRKRLQHSFSPQHTLLFHQLADNTARIPENYNVEWSQFVGGAYSCRSCYDYHNIARNYNYEYESFSSTLNDSKDVFVRKAKTHDGSLELQNLIKNGNSGDRQEVLDGIIGSIFEVMLDPHGHHLFRRILEFCDSSQLDTIFVNLTSSKELLINTSLMQYGSSAVQRFIKRIKNTELGQFVAIILSMRFVELMTSEHGRFVVQECFYTFEPKENEVLFTCAISYLKEVATTQYGCSSLNVCLSCITGAQRQQLLKSIVHKSDFLANDPYGNYVVQEVLMLRNDEITKKICDRLKRDYLRLSFKRSGSRVVEKCIQASEYGLDSVVESLLSSEKSLVLLARDRFGNYVIQTALQTAKASNIKHYESLVTVLKAQRSALPHIKLGKHILNHIEDVQNNVENV